MGTTTYRDASALIVETTETRRPVRKRSRGREHEHKPRTRKDTGEVETAVYEAAGPESGTETWVHGTAITEPKRRVYKRSYERGHEHKPRTREEAVEVEAPVYEAAAPETSAEEGPKMWSTCDKWDAAPPDNLIEHIAGCLESFWRLVRSWTWRWLNWILFVTVVIWILQGPARSWALGPIWIGRSEAHDSPPQYSDFNPLSMLSGAKFRALTERLHIPLGARIIDVDDPGVDGHRIVELCPRRPENLTIQNAPTLAPVCSLVDAVEAIMEEIEQNDELRSLPYNIGIRERGLSEVAAVLMRMPSRSQPEKVKFSTNVRVYLQSSLQTRNSLATLLGMNRALCGRTAYALITMGDEIVNLNSEDQQFLDLQRKRVLIVIAHQHAVSEITFHIRQMLSELSSIEVSARVVDEALLTIADGLHAYQERVVNKQVRFRKAKQYFSGWNEDTHVKLLSEQQMYLSRIVSDKFHLSISLNETTVTLETIQGMLLDMTNRLHDYFSDSDVSTNTLATIYGNLMAVYGRVLITQNRLNEANDLHQKVEYHLQREGNLTEIPYSKYKMVDGVRSKPGQ
ncbi:hypothetical protein MMC27_002281 [Xylographa pallens]|nr:hypothetical protein [Xylographa pallens]